MLKRLFAGTAALLLSALCMGYETTQSLELPVDALGTLRVGASDVAVVMKGADTDRVRAVLVVEFPEWEKAAADTYLKQELQFSLTSSERDTSLLARLGADGPDAFRSTWRALREGSHAEPLLRLEVTVPRNMPVNINHESNGLLVTAVQGGLVVEQGGGSVDVVDVAGELHVNLGTGSLTVSGGQGAGNLIIGEGAVVVRDTTGEYSINSGSGPVTVTAFNGHLAINNGTGSLKVENVSGPLLVADTLGAVSIRDVREQVTVAATSGSGNIEIANIAGAATIRARRGSDLSISEIGGALTVKRVGLLGHGGTAVIRDVEQDVLLDGFVQANVDISEVDGDVVYQ